uniref:Uncharacterized protein n=1 Tax=Knipowitschia caucasica TaxID=637954 RepID=A0AAV2MQQ4_KNICA
MPALSSIAESLSEREEDFYEVLPIGSDDDGKRIQADEVDENDVNSLQNSIIDWTEDETWTQSKDTEEVSTSEEETREEDSESDDSDTDYIPTIRIRPGASLAYNIDELPVATAEDIVYDGIGQDPHLPPCDDPSIPCNSKVAWLQELKPQRTLFLHFSELEYIKILEWSIASICGMVQRTSGNEYMLLANSGIAKFCCSGRKTYAIISGFAAK